MRITSIIVKGRGHKILILYSTELYSEVTGNRPDMSVTSDVNAVN